MARRDASIQYVIGSPKASGRTSAGSASGGKTTPHSRYSTAATPSFIMMLWRANTMAQPASTRPTATIPTAPTSSAATSASAESGVTWSRT